jgi:hypothetical protein
MEAVGSPPIHWLFGKDIGPECKLNVVTGSHHCFHQGKLREYSDEDKKDEASVSSCRVEEPLLQDFVHNEVANQHDGFVATLSRGGRKGSKVRTQFRSEYANYDGGWRLAFPRTRWLILLANSGLV